MFSLLASSTIDIRESLSENSVGVQVETCITPIIADLINGAVLIAALLFLVYLILGGIQWVTSGGEKGKVESARDKMIQAGIGLVVTVFAYTIYLFVINFLAIGLTQGSGCSSTGSPSGGSGSGSSTYQVGRSYLDGGSGGYCTGGGTARVNRVAAGVGPSAFPYEHFEPCRCESGSPAAGYTFMSSCYPSGN